MADSDRGLSDVLSTASSLLHSSQTHASSASHGGPPAQKPPSSEHKPSASSHSQKPSYGEILSSAHVVMNAAKSKLHKPSSPSSSSTTTTTTTTSSELDMGKLAGAAGTLIGAVSHYGKLDETGYGKYAHKAQEYLHSYEIKHGKPGTAPPPSSGAYYASPEQHGYGQGPSDHTSSHIRPSAPPLDHPIEYPPAGYPGSQQSHGYGHHGQANAHANAGSDPPIGYPPPGYPISDSGYNRPSK